MSNRMCAHADESFVTSDDPTAHVVVFITENEPGYHESTYTGDLKYCRAVAASINESRGLTSGDVLDIRASSMAASTSRTA